MNVYRTYSVSRVGRNELSELDSIRPYPWKSIEVIFYQIIIYGHGIAIMSLASSPSMFLPPAFLDSPEIHLCYASKFKANEVIHSILYYVFR